MTFAEARKNGWKEGDKTRQRGYVSRRNYDINRALCIEGKGSRKGQLYVLAPCFDTTQYCYRCYLVKD